LSSFTIEALSDQQLDTFDCGDRELNEWLWFHARAATGQGTRTYLLVADDTDQVAGYLAIAPHLVERHEIPKRVGRGAPRQIPAILLAKLAVDRSHHRTGVGRELLIHALELIIEVSRTAGGKIVVVDAIDDEAVRFYQHHDFVRLQGPARRLVMKLSTAAAALGRRWP
jgi:GNAT superfamily N-acetyltransferase